MGDGLDAQHLCNCRTVEEYCTREILSNFHVISDSEVGNRMLLFIDLEFMS